MKRIYLFVLLAAGLSLSMFADSYRDALSQYLFLGNVLDQEQYQQMLKPIAESAFPDNPKQGAVILSEYATTQMSEDMVDIYLPAFRKYVSEQDLKDLNELMASPRYSEIQKRSAQVLNGLGESAEYQQFIAKYQEAMVAIMQGEKPQEIAVSSSISNSYQKAFKSYYDASHTSEVVMGSFRSLSGMLEKTLRKQGVANPSQIVAQINQYTERNMPNVLVACFYKVLTEQDLQDLTKVAATPQYGRVMQAVGEVAGNPMQLGISLLTKMAEWTEVHYPQYSSQFQQTINAIKSVF